MKFKYNPSVTIDTIKKSIKAVMSVKKNTQTTFCYCDCGNEVIASRCCMADVYIDSRNVVHFVCDKCGKNTYYDFDFPAPVRLPLFEGDDIIDKYNNSALNRV